MNEREVPEETQLPMSPSQNPDQTFQQVDREEWLRDACAGFVTTKPANRNYYRLVMETLWPPGHGIPGPVVPLSRLRKVIDDFRGVGEPYQDVPRRIRELQGEEGFLGVVRFGSGKNTKYQLVSLKTKVIELDHLISLMWRDRMNTSFYLHQRHSLLLYHSLAEPGNERLIVFLRRVDN